VPPEAAVGDGRPPSAGEDASAAGAWDERDDEDLAEDEPAEHPPEPPLDEDRRSEAAGPGGGSR
jgi:hypothetical protein